MKERGENHAVGIICPAYTHADNYSRRMAGIVFNVLSYPGVCMVTVALLLLMAIGAALSKQFITRVLARRVATASWSVD